MLPPTDQPDVPFEKGRGRKGDKGGSKGGSKGSKGQGKGKRKDGKGAETDANVFVVPAMPRTT